MGRKQPPSRNLNMSSWAGGVLLAAAFAALLTAERRRPLRSRTEPALRRNVRNLAVAALSAATLRILGKPLVDPLAAFVHQRRWGILKHFRDGWSFRPHCC